MNKNNERFLVYLGKKYQEYALTECKNDHAIHEKTEIDNKMRFMLYIETILKTMPSDYALILRNDFFKKREEKWWQAYFTKSTYYRKKSQAIDEFVSCAKR